MKFNTYLIAILSTAAFIQSAPAPEVAVEAAHPQFRPVSISPAQKPQAIEAGKPSSDSDFMIQALIPNGLTFQRVGDRDVDNDDGVLDADYLPDFDDSESEVDVPLVHEQVANEDEERDIPIENTNSNPTGNAVVGNNRLKVSLGALLGLIAGGAIGAGIAAASNSTKEKTQ